MEYLPCVNRLRDVAREYWFELLIGALAVSAMCELVIASGSDTSLWFDMPAVALAIAAALRPPALSVRRPGCLLAPGDGDLVRRRSA